MNELREQLASLQDLFEQITEMDKIRQKQKIVSKTLSIINKLETIEKKLKTPDRTTSDLVKHMELITQIRLSYCTGELDAPINYIKREMELTERLYEGMLKLYRNILATFTSQDDEWSLI